MNIIGPDWLVFGVDDVKACCQYLTDYGLKPIDVNEFGGRFIALDGTGIIVKERNDSSLPPALATGSMLRKTIYGVKDQQTLDDINQELSKDREVKQLEDNSLEAEDDMGFTLGFAISIRKPFDAPQETINTPGAPIQRAANIVAVTGEEVAPIPRSLSHVVLFVPDMPKAEKFYVERLGFVTTDRFTDVGPFLRPAGTIDHHTLFLIGTPAHMQGCEHFTFHMGGPTELMQAGTRFKNLGYESFWGPGRHIFGSNWFWYFNSPLGCHVEYDADMDLHDDDWQARELPASADNSQVFLLGPKDKWMPGPD